MNNRIKELAKQAGYRDIFDNDTKARARLEQYTELIVGECANLNFRGTGFVTSEGEDMVRSMIKQHFGVEE